MNGIRPIAKTILNFLIGFLGSLLVGNLGVVVLARLNTPEIWSTYFTWVWRFAFAGLAVLFFIKKQAGVSLGIAAAVLLQTLEI